jgi:predicted ATPase
MLEKVGFKNFLALRDVEIALEPLTVIVGANASGKSSILEGIYQIGNHRNSEFFFYPSDVSIMSERFQKVLFKKALQRVIEFGCVLDWGESKTIVSNDGTQTSFSQPHTTLFESKKITFSKSNTSQASYTENLKPYLETSGAGLATVCAYLQSVNPEQFMWVQTQLQQIIPHFQKFRIEPARVSAKDWFNIQDSERNLQDIADRRAATGHRLIFDFAHAQDIAVEFVSEGTLFALTVLVVVASSGANTVILIDDLERGLHPKAVKELIGSLREIMRLVPDLQIVATSHSPYVLHELLPKEVRVASFDPELGTLVAPLEAYPNFDQWRNSMTPGEFWSFAEEDWVKDVVQHA